MKCPIDGTSLVMTDRSGVEIDYCPTCRGIWLDRGELDKIIERADAPRADRNDKPRKSRDYDEDDRYNRAPTKKRKVAGMLGDLFDF